MRSASHTLAPSQVSEAANANTARATETCRRLTGRVLAIKQILVERYRLEGIPMPLIREAIATAEAEAWLSGYPHLFLPDLADEILRQLRKKGL